jgi:hypothetical protein
MKVSLRKANNFLAAFGILGGIIIVALAFAQNLPFLRKGLPGPGFFPILCGIAIAGCGLLLLAENRSKIKKAKAAGIEDKELESNIINNAELRNFAYIIGASIFVLIMTQFIGMVVSIGVVVIGLIKTLGKESWKNSIMIGVGTTVVLYLIFISFLGVSLPDSFIGF